MQIAQMAALLLKKKYLDIKPNLEAMSPAKMKHIIQSVQTCMSADKKTTFLKRCCDILVKLFIQMVNHANNKEYAKITARSSRHHDKFREREY
jgi:endonuclease III